MAVLSGKEIEIRLQSAAPAGVSLQTVSYTHLDVYKRQSQAFVQLEDGRGRIECAFFGDEWQQYASLLTRDRILVVEGGLREDEFSGGFALRATRCWDFTQLCGDQAQRVSIRIDLRNPDALQQFERMLQTHAGATPILIKAITAAGIGRLTLNGGHRCV